MLGSLTTAVVVNEINNTFNLNTKMNVASIQPKSEQFDLDYYLIAGSIGSDDYLEGMLLDQDENVILYGSIVGNIGFFRHDPSLSRSYIPLNSTTSTVWENGSPSALSFDSLGNIYILGDNHSDLYLIKYSNSLVLQWNRTWKKGTSIMSYDMIIDSNDNIYVAGNYDEAIALIKYNSDGSELWNITLPNLYPSVYMFDYKILSKDSENNIYLVYDQFERYIEGYIDGPISRTCIL